MHESCGSPPLAEADFIDHDPPRIEPERAQLSHGMKIRAPNPPNPRAEPPETPEETALRLSSRVVVDSDNKTPDVLEDNSPPPVEIDEQGGIVPPTQAETLPDVLGEALEEVSPTGAAPE